MGGASIDAHGKPLTDSVLKLAKESNAVLLGAMGGPKWDGLDYSIRPERALLALRQELGLFANLRPVKLFSALVSASTLKKEVVVASEELLALAQANTANRSPEAEELARRNLAKYKP